MLYHLQNIKKESAALRQGDKLKNRYEIQRILGAGGSSNVYLAYDKVQKVVKISQHQAHVSCPPDYVCLGLRP